MQTPERSSLRAVCVACLLGVAACASTTTSRSHPGGVPQSSSATVFLDSLRQAQAIPGMAATVSRHGTIVWCGGSGFANREAGVAATPETRFRVGSLSKLFTAVALMRLVETGHLALDRPIRHYLSASPPQWPDLTLRQLAGHTAGVRHYRGGEFFSRTEYGSLREAITIFIDDTLLFPPGTRYAYTSYGYNLIGAVIEAVLAQPFPVALHQLVLDPLQMSGTVPDSASRTIPGRAALYHVEGGQASATPADNLSSRWPSGGYLSTTDDMAQFGSALLRPGFLTEASLALMFTRQTLASGDSTQVGLGWRIGVDDAGRRYLHHGGSSNGGSAFLLLYPAEGLVVAIAANALGSWSTSEALRLAAMFLQ